MDGSKSLSISWAANSSALDAASRFRRRNGDAASPSSTSRRMASERDVTPFSSVHLSIAAVSLGGSRMAENGSCPVGGRPVLSWAPTLWGGFIRNALPETRLRLNIWHDERYVPLFQLLTRRGWRSGSYQS